MADLKIPPVRATALTHQIHDRGDRRGGGGGLYVGRPVLMPLALAVLMSFALAPLVALLRHVRLGHVPSVLLSLALALVLITGIGTFVGSQFAGPGR